MENRRLHRSLAKADRLIRIRNILKKIGTLNIILFLVGAFFVWFNWQMLCIFRECGCIPESYACAVIAATIGECGICGWIRTNKDRHMERKWEEEDRKEVENEGGNFDE